MFPPDVLHTEHLAIALILVRMANASRNRAATKDCPFQIRLTSPLRFTALFVSADGRPILTPTSRMSLSNEVYRQS